MMTKMWSNRNFLWGCLGPLWKTSGGFLIHVFVVQLLSRVQLFATPRTAACQAFQSFPTSWNLLKSLSIESMMLSNHLILCYPLLLLPSIFPSIRVLSNDLALHIRWPREWNFSFIINSYNEYSGLISFRIDWFNPPVCIPIFWLDMEKQPSSK